VIKSIQGGGEEQMKARKYAPMPYWRMKVTSVRAFTHVLKSYIGSGVLGLPYAYAQAQILKQTLYTN
jgi:hypothetical protein